MWPNKEFAFVPSIFYE